MINLGGDTEPQGLEFLTLLLKAAADPKAAQEQLAAIKAESDKLAAAQAKLKKVQSDLAARDRLLEQKRADLDHREANLASIADVTAAAQKQQAMAAEAVRELERAKSDHHGRSTALDARENTLKDKEERLARNQAALDSRIRKLTEDEADYRMRMTNLRALAR